MTREEFLDVRNHGFARVAVVIPRVHLGKPFENVHAHLEELESVYRQGAMYALAPELGLTGYSCGDLFHSQALLGEALDALKLFLDKTAGWNMLISVGLPLQIRGLLFNCAITILRGKILAVVPKAYPPNYREFYEGRHFASAAEALTTSVRLSNQDVPFGTDILICARNIPNFILHTDICEDLWVPIPPGTRAALAGATILANLSASNVTIGKYEYREVLACASSGRNNAVQMYSAAGFGESTSDLAWDGHGIITERGILLARSERFALGGTYIIQDVDLALLLGERMRQTSFWQNARDNRTDFREVYFDEGLGTTDDSKVFHKFRRKIDQYPFVPSNPAYRNERCRETFMIQATSLARWLKQLPPDMQRVVIGVSGGQDSTQALLVAARAMDLLHLPRPNIIALTMPGFGTTGRTYHNACALVTALGATFREIKITPVVEQIFRDLGQDSNVEDLTFENVQAWTRKIFELAIACREQGIDLGTGDLSELMLGWCTMFGDHAAHYGVNAGVPKTLISYLIRWSADEVFKDELRVREALLDILATPISPELLRHNDGQIVQKTEENLGPYELHDFFGYYFVRFGLAPVRIVRMSYEAWQTKYKFAEIKKWARVFFERFFRSQLKRSCLPIGPKVGGAAISPRGDWRMPADMDASTWLRDLAQAPENI